MGYVICWDLYQVLNPWNYHRQDSHTELLAGLHL